MLLSKLGPGGSSPFTFGQEAHMGLHIENSQRGRRPAAQGRGEGRGRAPGPGLGTALAGISFPRVRSQTSRG